MPSNTFLGQPVDLSDDRTYSAEKRDLYGGRADEAYGWGKDTRDKIDSITGEVSDRALDTSKTASDWAKADRTMWEGKGVQGLNRQMDDALNWASDPELAKARGEAAAGANITFDSAGDMAKRALQGYGVDPSAGRYAGLDTALAAKRATASAGQQNLAMNRRRMDQQNLLNQANQRWALLPGQAANEQGLSLAAGNAAANTRYAGAKAGYDVTQPTGWVGASDKMHDDIRQSLIEQTKLGMIQNQQNAENQLAARKLAQSESSGVGAAAGLLGSVVKAAAPMVGGWLSGSGGVGAGGANTSWPVQDVGAGSGTTYRRGGRVPQAMQTNYKHGGTVQKQIPHYLYGGDTSDDLQDTSNIAGQLSSADPTGYLGFGSDALDIASDLSAPNDDIEKRPGDMLGITGEYDLDKTEQAGGSIGSMGGRIIGSIFGMPGVGAKVGRGIGEGVGAFAQGRIGEGFENMGRAALGAAEAPLAMAGGMGGGGGGMGGLPGIGGLMGGGSGQQQAPAAPDHTFDMDAGDAMERNTLRVAEGGEIPDDEMMDEGMDPSMDMGMEEDPLTSEVSDQGMHSARVVPPEASPSGGEETDDVHAMVNEGEFIIPKPVVNWHGEKFFQKLIEKAYAEMQAPKVAEPEMGPPTAMAIEPPSFQSMGA